MKPTNSPTAAERWRYRTLCCEAPPTTCRRSWRCTWCGTSVDKGADRKTGEIVELPDPYQG